MNNMPAKYNPIIGPATNIIVTPVPSGVIIAPKIMMITIAYLAFFLQKSLSTIPDIEIAYMINGSWKENPNANKNCNTKVTNSITFRNVTSPAESPYRYKNSKIYGITKLYENTQPVINNPSAGNEIFLLTLI